MEFFLIPLIAIGLVTFGIYKLTAMIFHIYLSGRLLILLVVFAWMVSLVLPGLFYQTAGFFGSVGISLVSAVGFAWLATTVDSKRHSAQMAPAAINGEQITEMSVWTPPAENAVPVLPRAEWITVPATENQEDIPALDQMQVIEEIIQSDLTEVTTVASATEELEPVEGLEQAVELEPVDASEAVANVDENSPLPTRTRVMVQDVSVISDAFLFEDDELDQQSLHDAAGILVESDISDIIETAVVAATPEVIEEQAESSIEQEILVTPMAEPEELQPSSDSLDDLLEFAFAQRTQNNPNGALVTFRLIRSLYEDSHALPMVVAELVSTLQSQGNYNAAIAELSATVKLPSIQQDVRLVRTFEQKLRYLQVLNAILNERGSPFLPFEQIPAEWQDDIEQGLLAGNRVQS